jgi:hypothetical protein
VKKTPDELRTSLLANICFGSKADTQRGLQLPKAMIMLNGCFRPKADAHEITFWSYFWTTITYQVTLYLIEIGGFYTVVIKIIDNFKCWYARWHQTAKEQQVVLLNTLKFIIQHIRDKPIKYIVVISG